MAFDVSALEAYVKLNGKDFAKKAVASAKTADLLISNRSVILGAKGDNQIPTFDVNSDLQDGSVVGRNASGNTTFEDKVLKISRFKSQHNYRADDLYNTYLIEYVAKGQNPETETLDTDIINAIIERRAAKIAAKVEELIWKGDKAGVSAPLNLMDGILKQCASGTIAVTVSGTDIVAKLQSVFMQIPVEISSAEDFRMFIGEDTYNEYKQALWAANIFHQTPEGTLAGFGAKFEVVSGLNGTDQVFASRISNLKLGMDKEGDMTEASLKWSIETEQWYMDFNLAVGIKVIFVDEAALESLA